MFPADTWNPSPYDIRALRYAEHFCVWAIRTSVACSPQCRTLQREFQTAFGAGNEDGTNAYFALLSCLGKGTRKVRIGRPGHIDMTADELSLVLMLAAAQAGDSERFMAHARWVLGHDDLQALYTAARRFTDHLQARGHSFRKVQAPPPRRTSGGEALRMVAGFSQ